MAMPVIHHRAPDFVPVLESAKEGMKWLFQTENDVLILTATGTGGMVAAVNNFFSPGEKVLVVNGGKFGERWGKIAASYGIEVKEIPVEWGRVVKPEAVEEELKKDKDIKGVLIQASETSTGVFHPVKEVGEAVRRVRDDVLFVVDAISGLVAHDMRPDDWGVDVMVAGSQKGLMLPPGLAFVSASERAWKKNEEAEAPRFYFNLRKERESSSFSRQRGSRTSLPGTPDLPRPRGRPPGRWAWGYSPRNPPVMPSPPSRPLPA
jgi:aspartate aminotransferase-like enzyme